MAPASSLYVFVVVPSVQLAAALADDPHAAAKIIGGTLSCLADELSNELSHRLA